MSKCPNSCYGPNSLANYAVLVHQAELATFIFIRPHSFGVECAYHNRVKLFRGTDTYVILTNSV